MKKQKLYLYVWQDVLTDWTSGIAFAIAKDANEARKLCSQSLVLKPIHDDLKCKPERYSLDKPIGFAIKGGG